MATYVDTLVFCTEAQVFAVGGYTWTTTSNPTDTQVYQFAQFSCGDIVLATDRAGSRQDPPASGISDVALRNVLQRANAVGAAWQAWRVMATGGDEDAIKMRDSLYTEWRYLVGDGKPDGNPGVIGQQIGAATTVLAVRTDESDGYTQFPSESTTVTLGREFAETDVD